MLKRYLFKFGLFIQEYLKKMQKELVILSSILNNQPAQNQIHMLIQVLDSYLDFYLILEKLKIIMHY